MPNEVIEGAPPVFDEPEEGITEEGTYTTARSPMVVGPGADNDGRMEALSHKLLEFRPDVASAYIMAGMSTAQARAMARVYMEEDYMLLGTWDWPAMEARILNGYAGRFVPPARCVDSRNIPA